MVVEESRTDEATIEVDVAMEVADKRVLLQQAEPWKSQSLLELTLLQPNLMRRSSRWLVNRR